MRKLSIFGFATLLLVASGCQKDPASLKLPALKTAINVVPGGGGTNSGGQVSGVSALTGYEALGKHYKRDQNGNLILDINHNPIWDGTYDATWYNNPMNITIVTYKTYAGLGDPVSVYIRPAPGYVFIISPGGAGFGGGMSSFLISYQVCYLTTFNTYSSLSVASFTQSFNSFINSGGSTTYPAGNSDSSASLLGGCKMINAYGKVIKINTDNGFALAELSWKPPVTACNAQCQYCKAHPNDPSCP